MQLKTELVLRMVSAEVSEMFICINTNVGHDVGASTYSRNTEGDSQHETIYMPILWQRT